MRSEGVLQLAKQHVKRTPIGSAEPPQDFLRACSICGQTLLKPLSALGLYFSSQPKTPLGGCIDQLILKQHVEAQQLFIAEGLATVAAQVLIEKVARLI